MLQESQGGGSTWCRKRTKANVFCLFRFNTTHGRIFAGRAANPSAIAMKRYGKQRHSAATQARPPHLPEHTHFRVGRSVKDENFKTKCALTEIDASGNESGRQA